MATSSFSVVASHVWLGGTFRPARVGVRDGVISEVVPLSSRYLPVGPPGDVGGEVYRLPEDTVLLPGLVDLRVAVGEPRRADGDALRSATLAAAGGGVTTIVDMSLNSLPPTTTPEALRGRASGLYQGGFLLGSMGGPAIGGLLGVISLTAPFYFYAFMLVVTAVFVYVMLPARAPAVSAHRRRPRPFREVASDVRYQVACTLAFGQGWQSFGVRNALIPIFVTESLLLETTWTGIAFAVAAVAQTLMLGPAGNATDRLGRKPVMIAAGLICGVATIAMPYSPNIGFLIAALCLFGVGAAAQGTAPTAAVADATDGRGGAPVAVFSMVTDIGTILGPLITGAIIDAFSFRTGFLVGGLILIAGAVHALFIPRSLDLSFRRHTAAS